MARGDFSYQLYEMEKKTATLLSQANSAERHLEQSKRDFALLISKWSDICDYADSASISTLLYWEQTEAIRENMDRIDRVIKERENNPSSVSISIQPFRDPKPPREYANLKELIKEILDSFSPDIAKFSEERHNRGEYGIYIVNKVYGAFDENYEWGRCYSEIERRRDQGNLFHKIELITYILTGLVEPDRDSLY